MTPAQTEQTQFVVLPPPPLSTRSTTLASTTSAAGAGIVPDSSILPRGTLVAPSNTSAHPSSVPKLHSDALSPSDRFILDEVIRHNHSTQTSPFSPHESQPTTSDGYHYKQVSLHKSPKSVRPFLRYVGRDFHDTLTHAQFHITGVYLVTPTDTTLEPTYCYRYYDLRAYSHAPTCLDDYEHEPCRQVLDDANYIFVPPVHTAQRRANKVRTFATRGVTEKAMTYCKQWHTLRPRV